MYSSDVSYNFPSSLTGVQRSKVHKIAERFGLEHDTFGKKELNDRYVRVTKVDAGLRELEKEKRSLFCRAVRSTGMEKDAIVDSNQEDFMKTPPRAGKMRCVQWNIAWMDLMLDDDQLCKRVAKVILDLDPCLVAIQEGPASMDRMTGFVQKYLNGFLVFGALEELKQQLFFLVKQDGPLKKVKVFEPALTFLSQVFFKFIFFSSHFIIS